MEVKVIRAMGRTVTVQLPSGANVGDALNRANIAVEEGEVCKLNGITAVMSDVCDDGDKIILARGAKGN